MTHPLNVSYSKHFPPTQSSCLFHAFVFIFALSGNLAYVRYSSLRSPGSCILFWTSSLSLLPFYQMSSIVPRYFTLGCFNYAWMRSASQLRVSIFSLNNCSQEWKSLHWTWEVLRWLRVSLGLTLVLSPGSNFRDVLKAVLVCIHLALGSAKALAGSSLQSSLQNFS